MGKIFKAILVVAAIAVNFIPGIGQVAGALAIAGFTGMETAIGVITALGVVAGASLAESVLKKTPRTALGQLDRLNSSIVPTAPRKMVLGATAGATDIRYVEPSGTDQEYLDYIIGVANHKLTSIDEIWLEDQLGWTASGGVAAAYSGYLWVDTRTEGNASNTITINDGSKWGTTRRLTGCAYIHLRIKRSGNDKSAQSPFASGLATRMTIRVKGMPLYDPRRDGTVGGNGSMRADDQSTWDFAPGGTAIGDNTALQILNYLLGWKINGELSVGCGLIPARIDMASFIAGANLCDEAVAISAGGTEPRYRSAVVIAEADQPMDALQVLLTACNGRLRDTGGKLSLAIMHNDLAMAELDDGLDDDDIIGAFSWDPDPSLDQSFNVVRGQYTDPSDASLYQPVDYPEVSLASPDGIDRILTLNMLAVESASQAQRIAKQALERKQYDRTFTATFSNRAWKYQVGDVVKVTFAALGFDHDLFRIQSQTITYDGSCPMVLTAENEAIYAWDASDAAAVVAADPTVYDPLNDPFIVALGLLDDASTAALADLTAIASDSVLSKGEKPRVVLDYDSIAGEKAGIDARATAQGVTTEKTNYDNAISTLLAYLVSLTPPYTDYTTDTPIVSATFIGHFKDVYVAKQAVLNAIDAAAYTSATNAATSANAALTSISVIVSDSILDKSEKPEIVKDYNAITGEQAGIDTRATAFGITTEKSTYDSAVASLTAYLASLSPTWNDYTTDTPIVRSTFISHFTDVYTGRQALLNKIAQVAGVTANWPTITSIPTELGDGRIPAGLDSSGNVNPNKVATLAVQVGALSTRAAVQLGATLTGSGSTVTVGTINITNASTTDSATVLLTALGSHNYSGPAPSWNFVIAKNGTGAGMTSGGGASFVQVAAVAGLMDTIPPSTTVSYALLWMGGTADIQLVSAILTADSVKRNT
jgi:hypothetical protein